MKDKYKEVFYYYVAALILTAVSVIINKPNIGLAAMVAIVFLPAIFDKKRNDIMHTLTYLGIRLLTVIPSIVLLVYMIEK